LSPKTPEVGLATARALTLRTRARVLVLEAERRLAAHQTGHNSGVIHSGLYYRPGSLKAVNCTAGREALYRYCAEHEIPHERCGKLVVATAEREIPALDELEARGRANGLDGLERRTAATVREIEPHVRAVAALVVPQTGIVSYARVSQALAADIRSREGEIRTGARVRAVERRNGGLVVHAGGDAVECRNLIACAGLQSDRVARLCGVRPGLRIIPFRGEYYKLVPEREHLVRHLVYPVPDPRFPFLGVHFTRMIDGGVEAGPNAVLALRREGYHKLSFSARDTLAILGYRGFWRMAARYGRTGLGESYRSFSRRAFVRALNALVPELGVGDVVPHGAGVRAQAVGPDGSLLDDFHILEAERMLHVLNAPSPAATASLSIGESLARRAAARFGLEGR
jgi:L-2-hydroxyglutarate oxidase